MSKVFVITPTYCTNENRRLPLLLQTLYSVQQQSYGDYLHIVVDDGSSDETPEILENLSRVNSRLKIFHKQTEGVSAAINYGLRKGLTLENPDYITICHSDDLLLPNSLEVRKSLAVTTGSDLVYTDFVAMRGEYLVPWVRHAEEYPTSEELLHSLLKHRRIPYSTMMWSTDFFIQHLQGFDPKIDSAEDWDIALRSARGLTRTQGAHAVSHVATMVKRFHSDTLERQNARDGTKERCYELILQKHLSGKEYELTLANEKRKIRRWNLPPMAVKIKEHLHAKMYPSQKVSEDITTFVNKAKEVDLQSLLSA